MKKSKRVIFFKFYMLVSWRDGEKFVPKIIRITESAVTRQKSVRLRGFDRRLAKFLGKANRVIFE